MINGIFCSLHFNILRAGYRGFNELYPSDHAAIWVDFDYQEILGIKPILTPPKPSCLSIDKPILRDRYNKKVWKEIYNENVIPSLTRLSTIPCQLFNKSHEKEYNGQGPLRYCRG